MLFTTIHNWSWPNLGKGSVRVAWSLLLFWLILICQPAVGFCADEIDDTIEVLGFHAKPNISITKTKECNNISHPVFDKIISILRRETRYSNLHSQLRSCSSDEFAGYTRLNSNYDRIFYVDMPRGRQFSADSLSAVFAHELYHVFQYVRFGSFAKVMAHYGSKIKSVELAADFGAGYLLSKSDLSNVYEMNPELSGGFILTLNGSHGTPAERSEAFRRGLYFTRRVSVAYSIENAEEYFLAFEQQ